MAHAPVGTVGLYEQLVGECQAMASYALASGLRVPPATLETLETIAPQGPPGSPDDLPGPAAPADGQDVGHPPVALRRIVQVHHQLVEIVAPATPRTLLLLSRERSEPNKWRFLGPVPLVRRMMLAGVLLLLTFIVTSLSSEVNTTSGDIFRSSGTELLINELFLLSAAGVGAAFAALFTANRYVARGTYDPKYESSYWIRFVLGLIAGIVLAVLVPLDQGNSSFTRPLLALLGGFSASVVYRILDRLVDTLESLFKGEGRDAALVAEQAARVQAGEQRAQDQLRMGLTLLKLRDQLQAGADAAELKAIMDKVLDEVMPYGPIDGEGSPSPGNSQGPAPAAAQPEGPR
ncbi:MAG TPA: hypothetical protein VHH09_00855 [Acidimicrobiales bacterium]|nr:hypothetical protein [Acidimicrobiales bacterium]